MLFVQAPLVGTNRSRSRPRLGRMTEVRLATAQHVWPVGADRASPPHRSHKDTSMSDTLVCPHTADAVARTFAVAREVYGEDAPPHVWTAVEHQVDRHV